MPLFGPNNQLHSQLMALRLAVEHNVCPQLVPFLKDVRTELESSDLCGLIYPQARFLALPMIAHESDDGGAGAGVSTSCLEI